MSYPIYYPEAGDTLPIFFDTFDGGTGASITLTGLAVTDIEIYKDGGVTQRASDAGYTLLDTDGIDFDGITGIHGFSIDLSDNTDAGFFAVGSWYHVVVSSVTIDAQTVNFVAAAFRILSATRGMAGTALPDAAADAAGGLPISDAGGLDMDSIKTDTAAILVDTGTTLENHLTDIKGTGFVKDTHSLIDIETYVDILDDGTSGNVKIATDVAAALVDTNSLNDTKIPDTISLANINAEVDTALTDYDPPTRAELTSDINSVLTQLPSDTPVEGTADSGSTTTMVDAARTEADTDYWKGSFILFTSGTISGQARLITAFTPASDTITFTPATTQAVSTNTYRIIPAAQIEEVLALTGHTVQTGDNFARLGAPAGASVSADIAENQTDLNTIITDTNELQTDWTDGGRLDLIIDAILADTNELQVDDVPGLIAALNDLSAAQVNAEVVDALATDTYAEPTGVPGATVTLATKLGYLYMALRNQITVTSTKKTFFDDGGVAEWEKDLSDDGTTYTETEGNAI